jgi:DnaJ like chaperone protein
MKKAVFFIFGGFLIGTLIAGLSGGFSGLIIGIVLYTWVVRMYSPGSMNNLVLESIVMLSLKVMKADKYITRSELYMFRDFMVSNFGSDTAGEAIDLLQQWQHREVDVEEAARRLNQRLHYAEKTQILRFLFQIAAADGAVSPAELQILMFISVELGINESDFRYIKFHFDHLRERQNRQETHSSQDGRDHQYQPRYSSSLSADYALLGVKEADCDQTIKASYRRLAVANHPDKFQHLGETARVEAEKRFSAINAAYNRIKKARKTA